MWGIQYGERYEKGFCLLFNLVTKSLSIPVSQFEAKSWLQGVCTDGLFDSTTVLQYEDDTIMFLRHLENLKLRLRQCF